jgi:hypothetical protein
MKLVVAVISVATLASAQDAHALLEKARAAFEANHARERYWIWNSVTARSILDKNGKVLETLPAVTVESAIRRDGKRCNAVLAWGDGVAPYLANASAEERCKVEEEAPPVLEVASVLAAGRVAIQGTMDSDIILAVQPEKKPSNSSDPATRCAGSLEGSIGIDVDTYFPKRFDLMVVNSGCEKPMTEYQDHYDRAAVKAVGGYLRGARIRIEYELQKDKAGDASRDYWLAVHRRVVQPLPKNVVSVLVSGRRLPLSSRGAERQGLVDVNVAASEVTAESVLKFEIPK